jgi:hypothetical protein
MTMQKLIVQKGARYEIRADEIAPGLYRISTCCQDGSRAQPRPWRKADRGTEGVDGKFYGIRIEAEGKVF